MAAEWGNAVSMHQDQCCVLVGLGFLKAAGGLGLQGAEVAGDVHHSPIPSVPAPTHA